MKRHFNWLLGCSLALAATAAVAEYHTFQINQIFSTADGTVQFVVLHEAAGMNGENMLGGHAFTATQNGMMQTYTFTDNLPGGSCGYYGCNPSPTANRDVLIATQGFTALGLVTPDYVIPNHFLPLTNGTLNYAGVDQVSYTALPTDGVTALNRSAMPVHNLATNFAGASGSVAATTPPPAAVALENPQPGSFQSGIGLISGWSCQGPQIGVAFDGTPPVTVPYGSGRADTASVCGATNINTGFGLLLNYNLLTSGQHTAQLFVNGQPQGTPAQFTVTVPVGEFLTGVSQQVTVTNFPPGKTTVLIWQQSQQNFAIMSVSP